MTGNKFQKKLLLRVNSVMSENHSVCVTDSQVQGKRNSQMQKNYFAYEQRITYHKWKKPRNSRSTLSSSNASGTTERRDP